MERACDIGTYILWHLFNGLARLHFTGLYRLCLSFIGGLILYFYVFLTSLLPMFQGCWN